MHIHMKEWKESIINSKKRSAIPLITHQGISLTGRSVYEAVTNAECHCDAVKASARRFPSSAATMIMDLSVEAEAFGAAIHFNENEVPSVASKLICETESIEQLEIPDVRRNRLEVYIKAAAIIATVVSDRPTFAVCIGPFSLAGRLYDISEMMTALYCEPEKMEKLIEKCTSFLINYSQAFKDVGVNGIVIAEPVAGMVSADLCTEFSSKYVQRIIEAVQDDYFMVILHNCGDTDTLVSSMQQTGAGGLHFGNKCSILEALKQIPPQTLVLGNIDPVATLKMGSIDDVKRTTRELLAKTAEFRHFILSSGCDVPPNTPLENVDAFYEALAEFNEQQTNTFLHNHNS